MPSSLSFTQKFINMNHDLGKPVKADLVKYLKEFTSELDIAKVCESTSIGFHTLRRLRLGETNIANTENANALNELSKIALINAEAKIKDGQKKKRDLTKLINTIFALNE